MWRVYSFLFSCILVSGNILTLTNELPSPESTVVCPHTHTHIHTYTRNLYSLKDTYCYTLLSALLSISCCRIYCTGKFNIYTGCNRRNGPDFRRVFLMLNYTEKPQNTYFQSWTFWEIMASEFWNFDSCYTLTDYQIRIETGRNMWFL